MTAIALSDPKLVTTGVAALDADHAGISDLINQLANQLIGNDYAAAAAIVAALRDLSARHFEAEEAMMAKSRYPRHPQHAASHREFMYLVNEVKDCVARRPDKALPALADLSAFFVHMVQGEDLEFVRHYTARQATTA